MNKWDKIFEEDISYKPLNDILLGKILNNFKEKAGNTPKTALDLGCGTGELLIKLSKNNLNVTGVDFSKIAIKKAREKIKRSKIKNTKLILSDLNNLKVEGKFDLIFCKLTYTFIENKNDFLNYVKKLMKNNSLFILITPVLYKNMEYSKDDKPGIAVDFNETKKILNKKFSKTKVLHHDYFSNKGDSITFIISK